MTQQGLRPQSELGENSYGSGTKVMDRKVKKFSIEQADFHGEWNNTLVRREQMTRLFLPRDLTLFTVSSTKP